ncbi:similar to Saccharomyces cerevisiae YLR364W GRX8 Glutaredoxin that employs a dithiol mechanism of catalysis [Maudiozyma barnettii]|uniref:Similar to Saccharomyces cerevisiae YLR364W GRX8 Glutaredoxin that employs a dithiol mechanism of catalysis n=1 Tax=Maudiozyma barnettii TaxID=61262 RepID=A0A8H2VL43_9SACH|nr:glutathione-disulfide reductase GRX8 [Kazachstania barnettii]CAB4257280.1 similar to Saccharomyces cerevisiae YLR364W GRX8 Glutaredoxin that employs a dithiol mechanism of catalysis [Kazachstania barnettii]CAD1784545.1 similar to Saccharomyces cerevisiae YLR364W GRX8 Glutaredoxin that employs a dithiol mechanism of catalysis [Kazachstania barnettii]
MSHIKEVELLLDEHKFVQFSANWCPDCQYANRIWNRYNVQEKVKVVEIGNLSKDEQESWRISFQQVTGSRNLPSIYVNGKLWGTESELRNYEDNNQLEEEFKKIGLLK